MKTRDRISGLFWIFLGVSLCIGAVNLRLGNIHKPGAGFMPFLTGSLLILFGLILAFSSVMRGLEKEKEAVKEVKRVWRNLNWKNIFLTLLALCLYTFLFEPLGFYTTTFMFLFFLFKLTGAKRWIFPILLSLISVMFSYVIFSLWLKLRFPGGMFGF